MSTVKPLTKNQQLVYQQLQQSSEPLGAYELLEQLRGHGMKAPLQIYRALDGLIALGKVHRLASVSAFVACNHPEAAHPAVFAICVQCGKVDELHTDQLAEGIHAMVADTGMKITKSTLELHGDCAKCR